MKKVHKLGPSGRMIASSKTIYRYDNPRNAIFFNANIFTKDAKKYWYGDLDLTVDMPLLQELAANLDEPIYVLPEMAGRFGTIDWLQVVVTVHPHGSVTLGPEHSDYLKTDDEGRIVAKDARQIPSPSDYVSVGVNIDKGSVIKEVDVSEYLKTLDFNLKNSTKDIDTSPLELFYEFLRHVPGVTIDNVSQVVISPALDQILYQKELVYLKKHQSHLHPAKLTSEIAFFWLFYGPVVAKNEWAEDHMVYIREEK